MGRGRRGPIDQSTKKPKARKNKERVDWPVFQPERIEENTELPILVSEEILAEMKKMRPQDLMNILIDDEEIADKFPEGTRESVQSCKCSRQYFGWGEMKKMNQIELMEKLLEINKCQGCH